MLTFIYDGTFEGLLTSIFEGYNHMRFPDDIHPKWKQPRDMFAEAVDVKQIQLRPRGFGKVFSITSGLKTCSCFTMLFFRKQKALK